MVQQNLIRIHTAHTQVAMRSSKGGFVRTGAYGDHQPETDMHTERGGGIKIEKTPGHLEFNTIDVLDSITPMKSATFVEQYAQRGKEQAMEATSRYARLGLDCMDPDTNGVLKSASQVVLEDADETYVTGWLPTTPLKIEYTPEELHFSYVRDRVSLDVRLGENEFDYEPGSTSTYTTQVGGVSFEYTGSPNYFPTAFQKFNRLV